MISYLRYAFLVVLSSLFVLNVGAEDCNVIPSEKGIVPELISGNPTACDLMGKFGFKVDGYFEGRFKLESSDTTSFYHCDESEEWEEKDDVYIEVIKTGRAEHQSFMFKTSKGIKIEKIIVKGGSEKQMKSETMNSIACIYDYSQLKVDSDTGLHAPMKADCKYFDISHIDFVFTKAEIELPVISATHRAKADFWLEKKWTIDEVAEDDLISGIVGDSYSTIFTTSVAQAGKEKSDVNINGSIELKNTQEVPVMIEAVFPHIHNGFDLKLTHDKALPVTLSAGEELICTYSCTVQGEAPETCTFTIEGNVMVEQEAAQAIIQTGTELGIKNDVVTVLRNGVELGTCSTNMSWTSAEAGIFTMATDQSSISGESLIEETGQRDKDEVQLSCSVPEISANAQTMNERFHNWSINKTASEETLHLIAGETKDVTYTVSVTKESEVLGYLTEGIISITIPGNKSVNAALSGVLDGVAITFPDDGGTSGITLHPGANTISFEVRNSTGISDPALNVDLALYGEVYSCKIPVSVPQNTLMVVENNNVISVEDTYDGLYWSDVDADSEWTYTRTITGNESYALAGDDGIVNYNVDNTARIIETNQTASARVSVMQYFPVIEQSAIATFNREIDWELAVTANEEQHEFYGDETYISYAIRANKTAVDSDFDIQGSVTISNPSPSEPMSIRVSDIYNDEPMTFNEVGPDEIITLQPGETIELSYSYLSDQMPQNQQNQLLVQLNDIQIQQTSQTINDDNSMVNETNASVVVEDEFGPVCDEPITENTMLIVSRPYDQVSLNESDFTDGVHSVEITNEFVVKTSSGEEFIPVTTDLKQYVPTLTKMLSADLIRKYDWDIHKTVSETEVALFAGESKDITYTVDVEKKEATALYVIDGEITVYNPNPEEDLLVGISEVVGGSEIKVEGLDNYGYAIVPAQSTQTFKYQVSSETKPVDGIAVTLMDYYFSTLDAYENYSFSALGEASKVKNNEITVTDTYDNKVWSNIDQSSTFTYTRTIDCSNVYESDFTEGIYRFSLPNTASIVELAKSAQANVNVTCYAPVFSGSTTGTYKECYKWNVSKSSDSVSFEVTEGEVVSIPFEIMVDAQAQQSDYELSGFITINNPHPDRTMELEVYDYFNLQSVDLSSNLVSIEPFESVELTYSQIVTPEEYNYNDVQIYFNGIDFYFGDYVSFEKSDIACNSMVKVEDSMLDYSLGTVYAEDDLPVYFTYDIERNAQYTGSPEIISNTVKLLGDVETEITEFTCNITMNVVENNDPVIDPDPVVPSGEGCTLTPGYWKTHNLNSGKYDLKWTNLPDMDEDGDLEYENEMFYMSEMSYHDVISSPSVSSCYIIMARAYGAAYLNILAGADDWDVKAEMDLARSLFKQYTPKTAEGQRDVFISTADILDKYNNGIIGPGHCQDSDRKSLTMTGVSDDIEESFINVEVYPNPSMEETKFSITIEEDSEILLEIYDAMGNLIEVLLDVTMETDVERNIQIPYSKDPGKVYFYRLIMNGNVESGTLIPG